MTKRNNPATDKVAKLKSDISKLTDRVPDSDDPRYLAQRLADLRKRKESGEDVRHRGSAGSTVISASMPVIASEAVEKILHREKLGASELIRKALALWANQNGYKLEAQAIAA